MSDGSGPRRSPLPYAYLPQPVIPSPLPSAVAPSPIVSPTPHVEVFRNAALSIANGLAFVNLPFDTMDDGALPVTFYNLVTGVFTCPIPGRYTVRSFVVFNAAGTFRTIIELLRNGAVYKRMADDFSSAGVNGSATARALTAGTTLQIQVAQASASNPAPLFVGAELCWAAFEYVGPLT